MNIDNIEQDLLKKIAQSKDPKEVLKDGIFKELYAKVLTLDKSERAKFGKQVNLLKQNVERSIKQRLDSMDDTEEAPIDITAPFDVNSELPSLLPSEFGSIHPLSQEINQLSDIFSRMGYTIETSREIDDQFNMFESLNFPKGHPARDDYDTFMTNQTDGQGEPYVAPAHTSTMQNRLLKKYRSDLDRGEAIATVVPDRVFRNEDLDARHEHTFYQIEGIYVSKNVNVGNLIATLKMFLEAYYNRELNVRVNPFYFPFTEPSFEFGLQCPFCSDGCTVCSSSGWIELLGCGMIHPNVLKHADIDPKIYSGFAFGCGIDRLVMMKYGIEDVRHFHGGKLDFLRQF